MVMMLVNKISMLPLSEPDDTQPRTSALTSVTLPRTEEKYAVGAMDRDVPEYCSAYVQSTLINGSDVVADKVGVGGG
jgi:hypothetical protein